MPVAQAGFTAAPAKSPPGVPRNPLRPLLAAGGRLASTTWLQLCPDLVQEVERGAGLHVTAATSPGLQRDDFQ